MPHGKNKKGRANNKKKNRGAKPSTGGATGAASASAAVTKNGAVVVPKKEDFPDLSNFAFSSSSIGVAPEFKTVYSRYKDATKGFKEALKGKVPEAIFANESASSLMDAVDYLAEHESDIAIEKELMVDLETAILTRKRASDIYKDDGDRGHEYFISILSYCWGVLRSLTKKQRSSRKSSRKIDAAKKEDAPTNRFEKLSTQAEDEEEEEEEEASDSEGDDEGDAVPFVVPKARPALPKRMSLDDLMRGTDRMDAILFLMSLDECMGFISDQYVKLKGAYAEGKRDGWPPLTCIEHLMETSVAVNFSIQLVATLEQQLYADHPHLNTVYRVLACIAFPEFTHNLSAEVTKDSPKASKFKETHAVEFIGDALESCFRNASDPQNKGPTLVQEFCSQWKIPPAKAEETLALVKQAVRLECPTPDQRRANQKMYALAASMPGIMHAMPKAHSWLHSSNFIGRNRSIVSTLCLLQRIGSPIHQHNGHLFLKQGYFGRQWDEKRKQATKIQEDMDEFLMGDVLPLLIIMCRDGLLSVDIPYERELLTFFSELKAFAKNPLQPVSWSLAFAVHAMLTSVMDVQGQGHVYGIGSEAKDCFFKFMQQIQWAIENGSQSGRKRPQHWETNMSRIICLNSMVEPAFPKQVPQADRLAKTMRAIWNPLCAGSFLTFITYFVSLDGGTGMIDNFAQLRMVLHLFNAFLRRGAFVPGEVPLLDWLHLAFKPCRAIWEAEVPPQKGDFVYRWWFCHGANSGTARSRSVTTQARMRDPEAPSAKAEVGDTTRTMTPIQPKEISKSFRRICLSDFRGVEDHYHTKEQLERSRDTEIYQHAVRVNDTLDAMEAEQILLSTNLVILGEMLNQFVVRLFKELELRPAIKRIVKETPDSVRNSRRTDFRRPNAWETTNDNLERQAMVHVFAELLLGPLDFHEEPHTISKIAKAAAFLKGYFNNLPREKYQFFMPTGVLPSSESDPDDCGSASKAK